MKPRHGVKFFAFTFLTALTALSSCTFGGAIEGKKGTLKISIFEGGNGSTAFHKLAEAYKKYNPEANIEINYSPLVRNECQTAVETGQSDSDIFFVDGCTAMKGVETYHSIADISELYSSTPKAGTKEENMTIAEKIQPEILEQMRYTGDMKDYQGKYYLAPWVSGPCSLIMNVDALNSTLGEGKWSTPRTSQELLDMCDRIVASESKIKISGATYKVYPFIYSSAVEYWRYLYFTWIAQYMGIESYNEEFLRVKINGKYDMEAYFSEGKYKGYEEIEEIIKRTNEYCDPVSLGNKFMASQKYFLQGRACFYVTGDWFEREMEGSSYSANMRMVRTPIISCFADKFEKTFHVSLGASAAAKEETLRNIVTAIDNGETTYSGLSEEQFNYIRDTRGLTYTLGNTSYGIVPECSVNKDMAIDFLRFFYSDEGIQINLDDTKALLPVVGASSFQPAGELSDFRKGVLDIYRAPYTKFIFGSAQDPIRYRGGLDCNVNNETPEAAMGKKSGAVTADEYLEKERVLLSNRWADIMKYVSEN